jgi:hypothetical protein
MSTALSFFRVSEDIGKTSVLSTPADPAGEQSVRSFTRNPLARDRRFLYYSLAREFLV